MAGHDEFLRGSQTVNMICHDFRKKSIVY